MFFSQEQLLYAKEIQQFAEDTLSVSTAERLADSIFDRQLWRQAAEKGLAGLPIPKENGGSGFGVLDSIAVVEALGRGCRDMGLAFSLCAHMFASAVPLWRFGSEFLRQRYLGSLTNGEMIAANAITEAEAGSDVFAMRATAQRDGDYYVLNGEKCSITNAPVADVFLIYLKTDPNLGIFGISGFLVPRDTPGLSVVDGGKKTGLNTTPWGIVRMENCRISASLMVGSEGGGAAMFQDSMLWERCCLFALYVGAMDRVLQESTAQAKSRVQFGSPIGRNQSISNRLVDMKLRLETSRMLLYRAGWLYEHNQPFEEAVALSKLWISECAVQCGLDAIQIFGGTGVTCSSGVDRLLLDSLPSTLFSGTSEIQREIVARHMGLR